MTLGVDRTARLLSWDELKSGLVLTTCSRSLRSHCALGSWSCAGQKRVYAIALFWLSTATGNERLDSKSYFYLPERKRCSLKPSLVRSFRRVRRLRSLRNQIGTHYAGTRKYFACAEHGSLAHAILVAF